MIMLKDCLLERGSEIYLSTLGTDETLLECL